MMQETSMSTLSLASSSMPAKQRSNRVNGTPECCRSLNDFHDAILKHILSFLPTKFVVRTSVLSSRWQFLWASLPSLEFVDDEFKKRDHFINFVDRAFILHREHRIHKFSLRCYVAEDVSRIKMWIYGAVRRDAKEFDISFHENTEDEAEDAKHVFPFCFFKCETMEVLKLDIGFDFHLPSQIYLPRLKILILKYVIFKDEHTTNLLFASPALEQLEMKKCTWVGYKCAYVISAPKLSMLTIKDHPELFDLGSSSVTISAPQLQFFGYVDALANNYRFPNSSSIIEAVLDHYDVHIEEIDIDRYDEFLIWFQFVRNLQLHSLYIEVLLKAKATVPIFKNLIDLGIAGQVDPSCEELEMFLNKCPRLETLTFNSGFNLDSETYESDRLLNLKFKCLPSTLKYIMIKRFCGSVRGILVVHILLAQMTNLETLEIVLSWKDVAKKKELKVILSALPRGSKSCKLNIR